VLLDPFYAVSPARPDLQFMAAHFRTLLGMSRDKNPEEEQPE
jgi:hypothetical protein